MRVHTSMRQLKKRIKKKNNALGRKLNMLTSNLLIQYLVSENV